SSSAASPQDQVRELTGQLKQASALLRQHQAFLRQKGMNLPSGAYEAVKATLARLDALGTAIIGRQIELRQLRGLAQTTAVINSTLEPDAVLNQVMDTVIQLTGAERGYILLRNPATSELEFQVARGIDREQLARDDFKVSQTIVQEVVTTGQPVMTDNAGQDPRYDQHESIVGFALRSILAVPLRVNNDVIGVVYCDNRILAGLFKDHELNLLRAFADQAAVAIQNARLFEAARAQLAEITEVRDLMDSIFTSVDSGLIALDADSRVTLYNPAAERITGLPESSALGQRLDALLPAFTAQIAPHLAVMNAASAARYLELELDYDARGTRLWSVVFSPLRAEDAGDIGEALVLDDLTEERRREQQVARVRNYLPLALVENLRSADLTALGGQEREISVLFCDLRGFTRFSERLEPEDLMQIVNRYLAVASDAIHASGGLVDKYMGDAVTGLFNTQLNPQAQHTLRALEAAVGLRHAVAALHEALPPEQRLAFGIGLHTGLAVLGNVGSADRQEFTAMGDALDTAKTLQEHSAGGEIILSAAACAALEGLIEAEPFAQPDLPMFRLKRLRAPVAPDDRTSGTAE
ncbi:MAG TPA: GAF domain-containing protein, partial [Candidatus Limnocylindrales bacterium]|nr:GAF domain-containing protein [Candidatus Limnocylindrales bacterium]